ncbi:hypothetical protein PQX77_009657 [Marasmius sp. AFHP31]|nr:hypothetical protein PQX77_009657 [Marasmius sp. AFHP31]
MKGPAREIDAYGEIHEDLEKYGANSGKEPGDPKKAAQKILDVVTSNEELPARLALGEDAVSLLDAELQAEMRDMERWREFGKGTNVEE